MSAETTDNELVLTGLDGCNPLAFMAALGALRALSIAQPSTHVRLNWREPDYRPILHSTEGGLDFHKMGEKCAQIIRELFAADFSVEAYPSTTISLETEQFRRLTKCWLNEDPAATSFAFRRDLSLPLLAAGVCEPTNPGDEAAFSELSFANGQSSMHLLGGQRSTKSGQVRAFKGLRTIASDPELPALVAECLERWVYREGFPSFRWCPTEFRPAALQSDETVVSSVPGANILAFLGLSFFPMVPTVKGARSTAMRMADGRRELLYPLWSSPMPVAVVESLLSHSAEFLHLTETDRRSAGIVAVLSASRFTREKGVYFDMAQER